MARGGASVQPGFAYHVIPRFVAKEWFIGTEIERRVYLALLGRAIAPTDWRCFSFAVMSNHIHLGLIAGATPLVSWLRPMHTTFAQWINERRDRIGAVFVRGPNVVTIRPGGVASVIGYIHRNPVRAGIAARETDSDWTSHRAYLGLTRCPTWLDVARGVELAGFDRAHAFATWMENTRTDRAELEAAQVTPRVGPGRPKTSTRRGDDVSGRRARAEPQPGLHA